MLVGGVVPRHNRAAPERFVPSSRNSQERRRAATIIDDEGTPVQKGPLNFREHNADVTLFRKRCSTRGTVSRYEAIKFGNNDRVLKIKSGEFRRRRVTMKIPERKEVNFEDELGWSW